MVTQLLTDERGRFEAEGFPLGTLHLVAHSAGRTSGPVVVAMTRTPSHTKLMLQHAGSLEVRVVSRSSRTPLPGGVVLLAPADRPRVTLPSQSTDVEGRARFRVPEGTSMVETASWADGHGLDMVRLPVEPGRSLELSLPTETGALVVEGVPVEPDTSSLAVLLRNGVQVSLEFLRNVALSRFGPSAEVTQGVGSLMVRGLAPGPYAVCRVPRAESFANRPVLETSRCASGALMPGSELTLALP